MQLVLDFTSSVVCSLDRSKMPTGIRKRQNLLRMNVNRWYFAGQSYEIVTKTCANAMSPCAKADVLYSKNSVIASQRALRRTVR